MLETLEMCRLAASATSAPSVRSSAEARPQRCLWLASVRGCRARRQRMARLSLPEGARPCWLRALLQHVLHLLPNKVTSVVSRYLAAFTHLPGTALGVAHTCTQSDGEIP